jgi:hypothetical protein
MSGKAMLTMKRSRLAMKRPTEVIKRTFQRFSMSSLRREWLAKRKPPYQT